jgi:hypothetical protein
VRDLEEKEPDWGSEISRGGRKDLGDEVLEIVGVALRDRERAELGRGMGEEVESAAADVGKG